jgi:hypothetical protein
MQILPEKNSTTPRPGAARHPAAAGQMFCPVGKSDRRSYLNTDGKNRPDARSTGWRRIRRKKETKGMEEIFTYDYLNRVINASTQIIMQVYKISLLRLIMKTTTIY